jgi:hypothetical protein
MIENEPDPLRRIKVVTPAEIRAEIGETLRAARQKRGVTVETAAQQTRIPKRFLEALEDNRFDEFPAFVYMRGFLKSYCDYLEAPFEQLWAVIQATTGGASPAEAPTAAAAPAPAAPAVSAPRTPAPLTTDDGDEPAPDHAAAHAPKHHDPTHAPAMPHHAPTESSATGALVFAGVAALALGIWMFGGRKTPDDVKPAGSTPRALMPLPRAVEAKIALSALDDAWVRATVDGSVVFEGRLPKGAAMDWRPVRYVSVRTSSPAALVLTLNGAPQAMAHASSDGEYRIDVP